ncbi:MAG: repeat protein [Myxococcaceae bacterium]|nr:repeat protein [Myxococcaceae bacterium]
MPAAVPADVVLVGLVDAGITDTGPTRVCPKVTVAAGLSCVILGDPLAAPRDVWVTRDGGIYVTEMGAGTVVRLDGARFTVVASGLDGPIGLREAPDGALLVGLEGGRSVARLDRASGALTVLAGDLGNVTYLTVDAAGAVFASAFDNVGPFGTGRVVRIDPVTRAATRYATGLNVPEGLFVDAAGALFVAEWSPPASVRRFAPGGGSVGTSTVVASDLTNIYGLLPDGAGGMFLGDHAGRVLHQRADGTREVLLDHIGRTGGFARTADGDLLVAEFVDFGAMGRLYRLGNVR